jgi:hypothetical protein
MAIAAAAATASAQAPEQAQKAFASAADVTSMITKARANGSLIRPTSFSRYSALRGTPQTSNTG